MKKAIKRTFAILAAATTLLVSGAMTASAGSSGPGSRYGATCPRDVPHLHGQFTNSTNQGGYRWTYCNACAGLVSKTKI